MAGEAGYEEVSKQMRASGFMNDPVVKAIMQIHGLGDEGQALQKSRTYRAFQSDEKLRFSQARGLPRYKIICAGLQRENVVIEVDQATGLMQDVDSGRIGYFEDVDDPHVLQRIE